MALKNCPFCAEEINADAIKCKHCGSMLVATQPPPVSSQNFTVNAQVELGKHKRIAPSNPPHDPLLVALLSGCCFAGLGQIVLGQIKKGVIVLIITIVVVIGTFGIGAIVLYPVFAVDAYKIAKKLKAGQSVDEYEFF
jgi:TM2 domain-containing membrane protein YozV